VYLGNWARNFSNLSTSECRNGDWNVASGFLPVVLFRGAKKVIAASFVDSSIQLSLSSVREFGIGNDNQYEGKTG